ncbi:MAG: hypothetical protein K2M79_05385 [Muribaculaceae bacterium]|nr:hypothetical protein [Muribaculaceae bacterium]
MRKADIITVVVALICIYAILTIKLDMFWRICVSENADNINEIILNLSYSLLAAVFFYIFIEAIPFYLTRNKIRVVILNKLNELKGSIHKAKTAIYLPSFRNIPNTETEFVKDFSNKDMSDAYQLGVGGFKDLKDFFAHNKINIRTQIQDILSYSSFLTETEIEILASINTSKYVNDYFFVKDFEMLKIRADLYDNQKEIGESIFAIDKLINTIQTRNKKKTL